MYVIAIQAYLLYYTFASARFMRTADAQPRQVRKEATASGCPWRRDSLAGVFLIMAKTNVMPGLRILQLYSLKSKKSLYLNYAL